MAAKRDREDEGGDAEQPAKTQKADHLKSTAESLLRVWARKADPSDATTALKTSVSTLDDALEVCSELVASPLSTSLLGGHAGWKLGWKGSLAQRYALYGPLFRCGFIKGDDKVSLGEHRVFCAEAEYGFIFAKELKPKPDKAKYSEEEVWAAVDHLELCIELPGARQVESEVRLHYVADALLGSAVVRGASIGRPEPSTLASLAVKLFIAGAEVASGSGKENPYDSPLASVTYCVNDLCTERGVAVEAGTLIIAGHTCAAAFKGRPMPPHVRGKLPEGAWQPGDTVRAEFETLGSVEATLQE